MILKLHPEAAYPQLADLHEYLVSGDWPACRGIVDAATPAGRTLLLKYAGERRAIDLPLTRAIQADAGDSTARALYAFRRINAGWRIRTDRSARTVTKGKFRRFHAELMRADETLDGAHPDDPAAWTARITIARGLELGLAEAHRRYTEAARIDPHHLPAQSQFLQQLCPKWGGDWDTAFGFARDAAAAAPDGAPNAVLVAEAHFDRWLSLGNPHKYFRGPEVRDEILAAAHRSVLHPDFRRDVGWVQVLNTFAMAFDQMHERELSATMFAALGPYVSELPWAYLLHGSPFAGFRSARAKATGWTAPAAADAFLSLIGRTNSNGMFGVLGKSLR